MMSWKEACGYAKRSLQGTASMLLEKNCNELFEICYRLDELAMAANDNGSSIVASGLYAASYRLAGSVKIITSAAELVLSVIDEHSDNRVSGASVIDTSKFRFIASASSYKPLLEKLEDYQLAIQDFAQALHTDSYNDLLHLASELKVLLEHRFVVADEVFQSSLLHQNELLEEFMESLYDLGIGLELHPVLKIDVAMAGGAMH